MTEELLKNTILHYCGVRQKNQDIPLFKLLVERNIYNKEASELLCFYSKNPSYLNASHLMICGSPEHLIYHEKYETPYSEGVNICNPLLEEVREKVYHEIFLPCVEKAIMRTPLEDIVEDSGEDWSNDMLYFVLAELYTSTIDSKEKTNKTKYLKKFTDAFESAIMKRLKMGYESITPESVFDDLS